MCGKERKKRRRAGSGWEDHELHIAVSSSATCVVWLRASSLVIPRVFFVLGGGVFAAMGSSSRVDLKVVLLGKEFCGKTSLVDRFLNHRFTGDSAR